jgi:hypothetical protein
MEMKSKPSKIPLNTDEHTNDNLVLFHQNIRGLSGKIDELNCSIISKSINPHLICLSEHYMTDVKISYSHFPNYVLGTSYACKTNQGGGVCIYMRLKQTPWPLVRERTIPTERPYIHEIRY